MKSLGVFICGGCLALGAGKPTPASASILPEKNYTAAETDALIFRTLLSAALLSDPARSGLAPTLDFATRLYLVQKSQGISRDRVYWSNLMQSAVSKYTDRMARIPLSAHENAERALEEGLYTLFEFLPVPAAESPVPDLTEIKGASELAIEVLREFQAASSAPAPARLVRFARIARQTDDISHADPAFAAAFDATFGDTLMVRAHATAQENLFRRWNHIEDVLRGLPAAAIAEISRMRACGLDSVLGELGTEGTLFLKLSKLRERNLGDAVDTMLLHLGKQDLELKAALGSGNRPAIDLATARGQILFGRVTAQTFTFLAGLIRDLYPSGGYGEQAMAVGSALATVATALDRFISDPLAVLESGPAGTRPLSDSLGLVKSLAVATRQVLEQAGASPAPDQVTLDQMRFIRLQIPSLLRAMRPRSERMRIGFVAIEGDVIQAGRRLEPIPGTATLDIARLRGTQSAILFHTEGLDSEMVSRPGRPEIVSGCLAVPSPLSESEFLACNARFRGRGVDDSRANLVAGDPNFLFGADGSHLDRSAGILSAFARELSAGLWANIQPLARFSIDNFHDRSLQTARPLANAVEWAFYADQALALATENPDRLIPASRELLETTNALLSTGDEIELAAHRLSKNLNPATSTLLQAVDAYAATRRKLRDTMEDAQRHYESNPSLKGYSLDAGASNLVRPGDKARFAARAIGPCRGDYRIPGPHGAQPLLIYPAEFSDAVANPIHLAEVLGLGTLEVCYDAVAWVPTRETRTGWFTPGTPTTGTSKLRVVTGEFESTEFEDLDAKYRADGGHFELEETRTYGRVAVDLSARFIDGAGAATGGTKLFEVRVEGKTERPIRATVFRGSEAELRKRNDADSTQWRDQLLDAKTVWVNENLGEGLNGRSALEDELLKSWAAPDGLNSRLAEKAAVAFTTPSRLEPVRVRLDAEFARHQTEFARQLAAGGTPEVANAAKQVDGAKALLRHYLRLAFPESMRTDDELAAQFPGLHGLSEGSEMLAAPYSFEARTREREKDVEDAARIQALRARVTRLISERGGREHSTVIRGTLSRLELFKRAHLSVQPAEPIGEALRQLREKIDAFMKK